MPIKLNKPIRPKPEVIDTPQCCVKVETSLRNNAWRKERYDTLLCLKASVVEINGQPYCRQHAGQLALDMWLKGDLIESKAHVPTERGEAMKRC